MSFDMSENIEILQNPSSLSIEDLCEEYQKLTKCFVQQKGLIDKYKQQIYTLEKENALKDNLKEEVESMIENHDRELAEIRNANSLEHKNLQSRLMESARAVENLELENERLKQELEELNQAKEKPTVVPKTCNENELIVSAKRFQYLETIENDISTLTEELAEMKREKSELSSQVSQKQNELEEMKEYYNCAQENLKYKTDELNEAQQIIDTMQEKLAEVETEILSYKNDKNDHNKKGNSLFAEVDDQRQQMRDVLSRQKQQYQMMKLKYEQSSGEISRLKRENADILNEIKECVNMFKGADKFDKSKLSEQIGFLKTENNRLNVKLKQTQMDMDNLAKTNGINWVSPMMEYCENETKQIKQQLASYGMKKCEAEGLYVQAQQVAAKWRFEALKSRCVIMSRELLLENNNIKFESRFPNMKHMVEQFSQNVEPLIDDDAQPDIGLPKIDVSALNTDRIKQEENYDSDASGSWSDVKQILSDINKKSEMKTMAKRNIRPEVDTSIILLPGEKSLIEERKKPNSITFTENHNVSTELCENKENVSEKRKSSTNLVAIRSSPLPSLSTVKPQDPSLNDSQDRVRPVNVEMFTFTFKSKNVSSSE